MIDDIKEFWPSVIACWVPVFLGIIITLCEDFRGASTPQPLVLILMVVTVIVMMVNVQKIRAKIGFARTFVIWMVPTMVIWITFIAIREVVQLILS